MRDEPIKIGDRVMYSAAFLRSTGQYTGEVPFLRGKVTGFALDTPGCRLATIEWDANKWRFGPYTVNTANLVREDRIALESSK